MQQQTDPGRPAAVRDAEPAQTAVPARADLVPAAEVLEGVLEDAVERRAEAWPSLRGRSRLGRWPRAAASAVVGAAAAVAVTVLVRRLATRDAPGAQDPEQVQAVVDVPPASTPAAVPPGAAVDEDGEAVQPA